MLLKEACLTQMQLLERFRMKKKGIGFGLMLSGAIAAGIFFVGLAVIGLILAQVGADSTVTADGNATKIVNDGKVSMSNFSGLGKILVYIIFLVITVGLFALVGYGAYQKMSN